MTHSARKSAHTTATVLSAVAVVAMCVFIFAFSSQPADDSTELSMGVVYHIIGFIVPGYDQMSPDEQWRWQQALDHPVRKTAHFLEYALLGVLWLNLLARLSFRRAADTPNDQTRRSLSFTSLSAPSPRTCALAVALSALYACTDEIHQLFVADRAGMITDVLLDSCGAIFGIALFALVLHLKAKSRQRKDVH